MCLEYESPLVSFVMPAFNAAPFVRRAIESLLAQDFTDFEIVAVDDKSTDSTAAIIASMAESDSRIRLISLPENSGGVYTPRRVAVEAARGKLVAPMDSDDWVEPDYLSALLERMRDSHADIVYPVMIQVWPDGSSHRAVPRPDWPMDKVWTGRDLVAHTLDGWDFGAGGGLISRNVYLKCFELYEKADSSFADEILTRQLLLHASAVAFSGVPYFYRMNEASVTHRKSIRIFDFLKNDLILAEMARKEFDADSLAVTRGERGLFHSFFNGLRLLRSARSLSPEELRKARMLVRRQRSLINWKRVHPHVSPRYYLIARTGFWPALILTMLYDKTFGRKQL